MPKTITQTTQPQLEELKALLNDPRTGLKDSSDTNKTRRSILALFEELHLQSERIRREEREKFKEMVLDLDPNENRWRQGTDWFDGYGMCQGNILKALNQSQ